MRYWISVVLFAAFATSTASAAPRSQTYAGNGEGQIEATIDHIKGDLYRVSVSTHADGLSGPPGCDGVTGGPVRLKAGSGTLLVKNDLYDPNSIDDPMAGPKFCSIHFKLSGNKLVTEEGHGCLSTHGISCGFSARLTRR
jgi:hypothetical protein